MPDRVTISVVTVCLNAGASLRQTIDSVLCQNCANFEYIIKDGGSTDGSLNIIPQDHRIRVIRTPDNGIFDAMTKSLRFVDGMFVNFLNAGDVYCDGNVLDEVGRFIEQSDEVEFFYGDVICPGHRNQFVTYPKRLSKFFLYTHMICHQSWFVKRETYLRANGFCGGNSIGQDQVFLYNEIIGRKVKYKHINRFVVVYDVHGVSSNPLVQAESRGIRKKARDRYYSRCESFVYSMLWNMRNGLVLAAAKLRLLSLIIHLRRIRFGRNLNNKMVVREGKDA
jgi:glycosyltransferase involved in cell wall biosynthesis